MRELDRPLGIVGGGQLAVMTAAAAVRLGVDVRVLASSPDDPAARFVPGTVIGDPTDEPTLRRFADGCGVVTFDHELVDVDLLCRLEADGVVLRPGTRSLEVATDKQAQKLRFAAAGLPLPAHRFAATPREICTAAERFGWPIVAKAARGGYDGRGVAVLADAADAAAWAQGRPGPWVVEPLLPIDHELAVQVARRPDGAAVAYPVARTIQDDGMCRAVVVPSGSPRALESAATALALRIADALETAGLLAVELFVVAGELVVNEIAARPHNTGHHTIDSCVTSQFENHVRAVLGLPLGDPSLRVPAAAMANVVGRDDEPPATWTDPGPGVAVHLYGKRPRSGRKLGHVTAVADDTATATARAEAAAAAISGDRMTPAARAEGVPA